MAKYFENLARALLGLRYADLSTAEQEVIKSIATGSSVVENVNELYIEESTVGDRLADRIANIAGSWPFIIGFLLMLVCWMSLNTYLLLEGREAFDPYPYILLNLVLSTLAALQAPFIMMSQNRQAAKDRIEQRQNYQVTLKTDLEIILLHQKLDEIRSRMDGHHDRPG